MVPSESDDDEASKETASGELPEDWLHVKLATGGEFMAVHPATNINTVIPRTVIRAFDLAFTVTTLSYPCLALPLEDN